MFASTPHSQTAPACQPTIPSKRGDPFGCKREPHIGGFDSGWRLAGARLKTEAPLSGSHATPRRRYRRSSNLRPRCRPRHRHHRRRRRWCLRSFRSSTIRPLGAINSQEHPQPPPSVSQTTTRFHCPLRRSSLSSLPELQFTAKSNMSQQQTDIQERIAAARREAEQLKEKIRAKRESSADTSRSYHSSSPL